MKNIEIHNGRTLIQLPAQALLQTDAWGAVWEGMKTGGTWTEQERRVHIKELELLALKLALETFLKAQEIKSLYIQMDNIMALTYFLKMGGTKNLQMVCLSKQIWKLLLRKKVTVTADHLPSALKKHADIESRRKTDSSEWKLAPSVFQRLGVKMGKPLIDLFASRVSHQLPMYVAWRKEPYSVATNTF